MFSRHLSVKFFLWFLLTITLTVVIVMAVVGHFSEKNIREEFHNWALTRVAVGRDVAANLLASGVPEAQMRKILAPLTRREGVSVSILTAKGEPVFLMPRKGESPFDILPSASQRVLIATKGKLISGHQGPGVDKGVAGLPIVLPGGEKGVFFVVANRDFNWKQKRTSGIILGLSVFLLVAWALSWLLAHHLARPLKELAQAADALGEGELSRRIQVKRRDEIGILGDRFNRMAENIQRLLQEHKQLLADISHELRTPLARQKLALELARKSPKDKSYLDSVERQGEALEKLIEELLTYSRLEAGGHPPQTQTISPRELAEKVIKDIQNEAKSENVTLDLKAPDIPDELICDPTLLTRALENVIHNAITYGPEKGKVTLEIQSDTNETRFIVSDQGPGVKPDQLERIFEPFVRTDSARSRETGGVGLGLAIARRAMEASKGTISATNQTKGLKVTLSIPK